MPEPIPGRHLPNDLDRHIYHMRVKYLRYIVRKCDKIPNMEFKYVLEELKDLANYLLHLENEVILIKSYFK